MLESWVSIEMLLFSAKKQHWYLWQWSFCPLHNGQAFSAPIQDAFFIWVNYKVDILASTGTVNSTVNISFLKQ